MVKSGPIGLGFVSVLGTVCLGGSEHSSPKQLHLGGFVEVVSVWSQIGVDCLLSLNLIQTSSAPATG